MVSPNQPKPPLPQRVNLFHEDCTMAIATQSTRRRVDSPLHVRAGSTLVIVILVIVGLLLAGGITWYFVWGAKSDTDAEPILHKVERGLFNHTVVEQGEVESSKNIELRCEVKARSGSGPSTSIIEVVPE